jgi:hypothetical protein
MVALKIALFLITAALAAASAIGIQYYNKCPSLKEEEDMKRNFTALVAILVVGILIAGGAIYFLR